METYYRRSLIFHGLVIFILCALVFCLHLFLCEGVKSPETRVTDSYELPLLRIEPGASGRAASALHC